MQCSTEACCAVTPRVKRDEAASYDRCRRAPHRNICIRTFSSDMFLNKHSGFWCSSSRQIQIAMATQPPHRMICKDGSVYEIASTYLRSSSTLCMRQIMPVQRDLSFSDLNPELLQFYESFTSRIEKMKKELPETEMPWFFYYDSVRARCSSPLNEIEDY